MAKQTPILVKSFPGDVPPNGLPLSINTAVVFSSVNAGNVSAGSAGALGTVGVVEQNFDRNNYGAVRMAGIAQCRTLTGTAINIGDRVKIGDTNGRVTKLTPAAAGAGVLKGVVGMAMSAVVAGDPSDTLIDVWLTPGHAAFE